MLVRRENHWIFIVFDRSRTKGFEQPGGRAGQGRRRRLAASRRIRRGQPCGRPRRLARRMAASAVAPRPSPRPPTACRPSPWRTIAPRAADDGIELSFAAEQSVETRAAETSVAGSDESDPLASELVDWLQLELRRGRDIQQEAVLCALGALAGYAAQQAIRETLVKTGKLTLDQAFAVIETRSGEVFFFGELLNAVIVGKDSARNFATATARPMVDRSRLDLEDRVGRRPRCRRHQSSRRHRHHQELRGHRRPRRIRHPARGRCAHAEHPAARGGEPLLAGSPPQARGARTR